MKLPDKIFGTSTKEAYKRVMERLENEPLDKEPPTNTAGSQEIKGIYEIMPKTNTYALGVHELQSHCTDAHPFIQENGKKIYRPLTFKENIEARVNDYNTLKNPDGSQRTEEERTKLFQVYLDTYTGIAYKAKNNKFKIIPISKELINKDFNQEYIPINYNNLQSKELDLNNDTYNTPLTKDVVLKHEGWNTALENDKNLLKEYTNIIFSLKTGELMGFWTTNNPEQDQMRALGLGDILGNSDANGNYNLYGNARFLQVAHKK